MLIKGTAACGVVTTIVSGGIEFGPSIRENVCPRKVFATLPNNTYNTVEKIQSKIVLLKVLRIDEILMENFARRSFDIWFPNGWSLTFAKYALAT